MYKSFDIDTFHDIRASLHSSARVREVLQLLAKKSAEVLNAKGALVRILDLETNELKPAAAYGLGKRYFSDKLLSKPKTILDLYEFNRIVIISDIMADQHVQHPKEAWEEGIRMMMDAPLSIEGKIVGIIRVYFGERREFSREELNFLITCAACGGCAIEKARLMEEQQSQYDNLALQTEKLSALGRMAAGIAHEINNPLAGILLYSTNMMKKIPKDGPLKEGLEIIISETTRCGKIIQELLDFSRGGEPNRVPAKINDIIEKALSILENEFRLHHIIIERQLSAEIPENLLDSNLMEQVFVNLLLNSVEAIQDQGTITVQSRVSLDRKSMLVEITDDGCGISLEQMSKIFEPFFSSKANGTGLGLSVSYGIVQKHQGNIWVSSQPGQETRFHR